MPMPAVQAPNVWALYSGVDKVCVWVGVVLDVCAVRITRLSFAVCLLYVRYVLWHMSAPA